MWKIPSSLAWEAALRLLRTSQILGRNYMHCYDGLGYRLSDFYLIWSEEDAPLRLCYSFFY